MPDLICRLQKPCTANHTSLGVHNSETGEKIRGSFLKARENLGYISFLRTASPLTGLSGTCSYWLPGYPLALPHTHSEVVEISNISFFRRLVGWKKQTPPCKGPLRETNPRSTVRHQPCLAQITKGNSSFRSCLGKAVFGKCSHPPLQNYQPPQSASAVAPRTGKS